MTDSAPLSETGFYNSLASDYDALTGAAGRQAGAVRFAEQLTARRSVATAIDAACGTGLFARALAQRGVRVTGADISDETIRLARQTPQEGGPPIEWLAAPMQTLDTVLPPASADVILCMGNSLPHLLTDSDLRRALRAFHALLKDDGEAFIHLLNYSRVVERSERLVGVTRSGEREYIRFYDFLPERFRFNVLIVDSVGTELHTRWQSTELRPYRAGDLVAALTEAGFDRVETVAGPDFSPFDKSESETVMLVGRRG